MGELKTDDDYARVRQIIQPLADIWDKWVRSGYGEDMTFADWFMTFGDFDVLAQACSDADDEIAEH